jgi:AraC family L-rhamnose operon regulatory protein RhaS
VCGYVERHYDQKITLPLLSELFYIGVRQLNRQFNRHLGTSVIGYVQRIRMERAKRLLVETDEKIIQIAELVGYEDAASFSRTFTREVGCPPGKYREQSR